MTSPAKTKKLIYPAVFLLSLLNLYVQIAYDLYGDTDWGTFVIKTTY